jgi:hypothetical protein
MKVRDGPGGQVRPYNTTKSLQRLLLECSACTKITVQTFQEIVDHMHGKMLEMQKCMSINI